MNGLFIADSLGGLLNSGYSGGYVWDLRNGSAAVENNSNLLYGCASRRLRHARPLWAERRAGLQHLCSLSEEHFALQLASKIIVAGGQVVSAASSYGDPDVYVVRESQPGDLELR